MNLRRSRALRRGSGNGPLGPVPTLSFTQNNVSSSAGVVTSWGVASTIGGSPLIATDSVTGRQCVRFKSGATVSTANSVGAFLSTAPYTFIAAVRMRLAGNGAGACNFFSTTAGGTVKGAELHATQVAGQKIYQRIYDGVSYTLDDPGLQGHFIEQKWIIVGARLTTSAWDVWVDGQFVALPAVRAISLTFPGSSATPLVIGGGAYDVQQMNFYNSLLSDADFIRAMNTMAAQCGVDMLRVIGGDFNLQSTTSALFPYVSKLPSGKLYITMFNGSDESARPSNFMTAITSADTTGDALGAPVTILTGVPATSSVSDVHTTEPLSDGSVIQSWFNYDNVGNITTTMSWRRSTGFNADGSPVWGATQNVTGSGLQWLASGAQIVENPNAAGEYHWPAFQLQNAHTKEDITDIKSTNSGTSWTFTNIAIGDTDVRRYAEPAFEMTPTNGEIWVKSRIVSGTSAYEGRSTDSGGTWSAMADSTANIISSMQGYKRLADGSRILGPGRVSGSYNESAMWYQAPGGSFNSTFTSPPSTNWIDPFFGGNYYGGSVEVVPGNLTLVFGRSSSNNAINNVGMRLNFYTWYLTHQMPGDATPHTAALQVTTTQTIQLSGAGDYTSTYVSNASGGNIVISGETATYTAGASNGTDTFYFSDGLGVKIGPTLSYVVSGATTLDPTTITGASLVLRADHATNTGDGTNVTAWNDEMSLRNMGQSVAGDQFTWHTSGINSKPDVTSTGSPRAMFADQAALGTTALTLAACVSTVSASTDAFIVGARYNNYHYDIGTDAVNAGQFVFRLNTDASGVVVIKSNATNLNDGSRHTIIGTWDGTTMKMYVDGTLQTQTAACTGNIVAPSANNDNNSIGGAVDHLNAPANGFIGHIKGANAASTAITAGQATALNGWYAVL